MDYTAVTLRTLRTLLAVGQAKGFSAAAMRLGRTQPAVSRAIAQLEAGLGVRMVDRQTTQSALTPAGKIMAVRATRVIGLLESLSERLARTVPDRELRAAIATARAGTLSAAGRRLGVSQPALSQSLASLETRLGRKLFERSQTATRLAPGAGPIVQTMALALSEIELGCEEVRFLGGASDGRLRIGALPIARPWLLPRAIDAVLDRYPLARIAIMDESYETLEAALRSGEIDAIVGSLRKSGDGDAVEGRALFSDRLVIVASPGHGLPHGVTLADLAEQSWVLPFRGVPLREEFETHLAVEGIDTPQGIIETDSITAVRGLLAGRPRLAVVSQHQVLGDIEIGAMILIDAGLSVSARPVGITALAGRRTTPLYRAFEDALADVAGRIGS